MGGRCRTVSPCGAESSATSCWTTAERLATVNDAMVASIEYIEKVIATYRDAARINLESPGREGNIVVLSEELAGEVMVTGDLHGHRRNFNAIRRIAALDGQPRRHLVLQEVCHGGPMYPNGGCMSHAMLEDVTRMIVQYPGRVHFLLSNHELSELTDYPIQKNRQMLNLLPYVLVGDPGRWRGAGRSSQEVFVWHPAGVRQRPWLLRVLYLLFVGWWASLIWVNLAWLMCITIFGLPFGILMLDCLPTVATLLRVG